MYLYSDPFDDLRHTKDDPGAYEWWYFDALDPVSGFGIVAIFYDGLLFSPDYHTSVAEGLNDDARHHPGFSLSIYHGDRTIFYSLASYPEGMSQFSDVDHPVKIGNNWVRVGLSDGKLVYDVNIDETLPSGLRACGELRFESPAESQISHAGDSDSAHRWNLVQPSATVNGEIKLSIHGTSIEACSFSTRGYHDHNIGLRQLEHDFDDWYWGRVHIGDDTLVWYNMKMANVTHTRSWLFKDGIVDFSSQVDMKPVGNAGRSIFGLEKVESWGVLINGSNGRIVEDHVWDNGPFYQRYRVILLDADGHSVAGASPGIAEYIKPSRITARWVRPMIRIRHHSAGAQGNWIQRSLALSRLTW